MRTMFTVMDVWVVAVTRGTESNQLLVIPPPSYVRVAACVVVVQIVDRHILTIANMLLNANVFFISASLICFFFYQ